MYDILIKNGTIIDGTAEKRFVADIGITGDKIKTVGDLANQAKKIIEAPSFVVSPGFIDITNRSDSYLTIFTQPTLESLLRQGITTIIGGNCGSSLAPLVSKTAIEAIRKWADLEELNTDWQTIRELFEVLTKRGLPLNFGTFVGHSTLRRGLIGDETRNLKLKELIQIKKLAADSLSDGALGVSTGLSYSHVKSVRTEEIIELAETAAKNDALYATHLRDEGKEFLSSINETIRIAKETGAETEISHLKVLKPYAADFEKGIAMIEAANKSGTKINFDLYPYTAAAAPLHPLLPDFILSGGREKIIKRLKNKKIAAEVILELREKRELLKSIIISSLEKYKNFIGKSVGEIAEINDVSPEETFINILKTANLKVVGFIPLRTTDHLIKGFRNDLAYLGSNDAGYSLGNPKKSDFIHPRAFGAFARFFSKFSFENDIISQEKTIYKMSGGPASKLKIGNRGLIKAGYFADIVIFDQYRFRDLATFQNPYQYAQGVKYLIINGKIVIENGELKNTKAGRIITR